MRRQRKTLRSPTQDMVGPNTRWVGKTFGAYRIRSVVDQDADSVTLLAEEAREGEPRRVLLRRLDGRAEEDPSARRRFEREATLCLAVRHTNLVSGLGRPVIAKVSALALEYDGGRRWSDLLRVARNQGGRVPPGIAVLVASRVAAGLDHVHRLSDARTGEPAGVAHGAVRPEVVHVNDAGWVRLSGLGREPRPTSRGGLIQSMRYLSPEQAEGRDATPASDVYSLAVVLAEALTGRTLFSATDPKELLADVVRGQRPAMVDWLDFRATALEEALERGLAVDAAERYPTAAAFAWALERALAQLGAIAEEAELAAFVKGLEKSTADLVSPPGMAPPDPDASRAAVPLSSPRMPRPRDPNPLQDFLPIGERGAEGRPLVVTPLPVVAPPVPGRARAAAPLDAEAFDAPRTILGRRGPPPPPPPADPVLAVAHQAMGPQTPASDLKGRVWTHTQTHVRPRRRGLWWGLGVGLLGAAAVAALWVTGAGEAWAVVGQ